MAQGFDLSDYVGLPFAARGRDRTGLDCWGLLRLVYAECFGLAIPSYRDDYAETLDAGTLADLIADHKATWLDVQPGSERAGDVLLMSLAGAPMHVGVIAGGGRVLHIERGTGSLIEAYGSARLRRRVLGIHRHPELSP